MFMKKSKKRKERVTFIRNIFSALLRLGLRFKVLTILIALCLVGASVYTLTKMDLELLPNADKMLLDVEVETPNLYDIRLTENAVEKVSKILDDEEQVDYYLSAVGGRIPKYDFSSMPGIDATHIGNFVVKIKIDEDSKYQSKAEYCTYLNDKMAATLDGCRVNVKELGIIPKTDEPVQIKFCGDDYTKLNALTDKAEAELKSYDGVKNVYNDKKLKTYNYYVDMKNDKLNSNGLTKAEVQNEMNIALMGRSVTSYRKDGKEYPIMLQADISSVENLKNLKVKSSVTGGKYSVSQFADVGIKDDYSSISRYNGIRCTTLTANPAAGKSAVMLQKNLKDYIESLPESETAGIDIDYEGDMDMLSEILVNLGIGAAVGTFVIFLILFLQFYSVRKNIIILMTIPFGLIGSTFGLNVCGYNLSMFAILGIISLIGVVVNNAIVLVDYMDGELASGVNIDDACKTAVDKRFRPVMLSTVTSVLGLIPLILSGNVLFTGMSIAFMFGLSTSLFFTMIVIPVLYSILMRKRA
jgi:multidrug efflux pump subunit AcrB